MKKSILSLMLVIGVCLSLTVAIPTTATAATKGIYTYSVSNGQAKITDCDASASGQIVIPDTLGGYPVTSIGNRAFEDCTGLTSVTIPDSVTSIGNYAFEDCAGLTSVTIPSSVTSIGSYAFYYCTGLTSVTIPDSVTSIEYDAFFACTGLARVDITDMAAWCKIDFGCDANPLSYAHNLYLNGTLVTNLVIPDGVTSIGDYAFYNCDGLTSVTIPDSVTSIGKHAFYNCDGLPSVTIPDSVTSIGNQAFYYCNGLTRVDITDMAAWCKIDFGYDANPLYYARNLYLNGTLVTKLVIPDGVTSIGDYAFYNCDGLTSVTIPDSVTSIGEDAFCYCNGLTSVTIGDGVTSIGDYAFYNCIGLTSVTIGDSVTSIGDYAFSDCAGLTSVTIPDSVTIIGDSAFSDCDGLNCVTVGSGVELISEGAFSSCSRLKSVCLPKKLLYIRNGAFNDCDNIETVFYAGSESQWGEILFYNRNDDLTNAKVVYNATKKTYKFETNCGVTLPDVTDYAIFTAPTVKNEGLTLQGWYDNRALSGEAVTFPYYGNATTLYAAWTDRTGASFEDALIVKANQQYTVTTTASGQLVYFEFVPNLTKEYRFYSTGSVDTYGYLYNSSKNQLKSDDDSGDGSNFYLSYRLTAGETYYIAAKCYSGTGTFTLVTEESVDYRINSITLKDLSGNELSNIPTGTFLATVSFTNVSSSADTVIVLAEYSAKGDFMGLMYVNTEDVPTGSTIKLTLPVENTNGDVAELKAFCWASFNALTPMGNSVSFPVE